MSEDTFRRQQTAGVMEMLRHRYGASLTEEQLEEVERNVESMATITETFRAINLGNGVEPYSVFSPLQEEGGKS